MSRYDSPVTNRILYIKILLTIPQPHKIERSTTSCTQVKSDSCRRPRYSVEYISRDAIFLVTWRRYPLLGSQILHILLPINDTVKVPSECLLKYKSIMSMKLLKTTYPVRKFLVCPCPWRRWKEWHNPSITTKKTLDRKNTKMIIFGARKGGSQSQIRYDDVYKRSKPNEIKVLTSLDLTK